MGWGREPGSPATRQRRLPRVNSSALEAVAQAAHGEEVAGVLRVLLELQPQLAHEVVHSKKFPSVRSLKLAIAFAAAAVLTSGGGPVLEGEANEASVPETETVQQALYTMTVIWPSAAVRSEPNQSSPPSGGRAEAARGEPRA